MRISTYHHLCQISSSGFSLQQNVNLTFGFNLNFAFEFRPFYKLINYLFKCHSPVQPISEIDILFHCKHWARQVFCEGCQQLQLAAFVVKLRHSTKCRDGTGDKANDSGEGAVRACFVCTGVDVARTMNICATANSSLLFIVVNTKFSDSWCFLTLDV